MTGYSFDLFTATTADEEENYFSGSSYRITEPYIGGCVEIKSGPYRVVDERLVPIASGLPVEDIRKILEETSKR